MASTLQLLAAATLIVHLERQWQFPVPFRCHGAVRLCPFRSVSGQSDVVSNRCPKCARTRRSSGSLGTVFGGGPNGIRTRVSALRGPHRRLYAPVFSGWLPRSAA